MYHKIISDIRYQSRMLFICTNTICRIRSPLKLVNIVLETCQLTWRARQIFHFWQFVSSRVYHRFEWFEFQLKAERSKYVCDFSCWLASTKSISKFNVIKISWLQNNWKWPKHMIKSSGLSSHRTIGVSPLSRVTRHRLSNKYRNSTNPIAINMQRIALTDEKSHFPYCSMWEVVYYEWPVYVTPICVAEPSQLLF